VQEHDAEEDPAMTQSLCTQRKLEEELDRLKCLLNMGHELKVRWAPGASRDKEGEVKGEEIRIYKENPNEAIDTLWDEFLDWVICQAIKPYERIVNLQRLMINDLLVSLQEEAYRQKNG